MDADMTQYVMIGILGLGQAWQGICLWAVAKRLQEHIKKGGHDDRNLR